MFKNNDTVLKPLKHVMDFLSLLLRLVITSDQLLKDSHTLTYKALRGFWGKTVNQMYALHLGRIVLLKNTGVDGRGECM